MRASIHTAKTQLPKLIEAALRGEEVIIAKGSVPIVRLEPIRSSGFKLGRLKDKVASAPDFLEPMSDEKMTEWEGR